MHRRNFLKGMAAAGATPLLPPLAIPREWELTRVVVTTTDKIILPKYMPIFEVRQSNLNANVYGCFRTLRTPDGAYIEELFRVVKSNNKLTEFGLYARNTTLMDFQKHYDMVGNPVSSDVVIHVSSKNMIHADQDWNLYLIDEKGFISLENDTIDQHIWEREIFLSLLIDRHAC